MQVSPPQALVLSLFLSFFVAVNPLQAQVLINEVDADNPSTDTAEFVELFGTPTTSLDGYVLVFYNGSNDLSYAAFDLDGHSLDAGGFFVLCGNAANVANCDLDVSPDANLIQNGADAVALYLADGTDFPTGSAVTTTNLVDALVYDTNDSDDAELLVLLNAGQPQINEAGGGDATGHSNSRLPDGGIARNTGTYVQQPPTPGTSNSAPPIPDVVINEVDADNPSTDTAEFVELFGTPGAGLDGLALVFFNGSTDASYAAFDLDGQSLNAEGFFVLCGDAANVANCDLDVSPDANLIQNGADAVALYVGDDTDFPNGSAVTTSNLLDALVYDTNDADDIELLVLLNPAQPQVNEAGGGDATAHSNSRVPDGGVGRDTDTYDQQAPTPGESNVTITSTVLINEVDADTPGSDTAEFIELIGTPGGSLDGLVVVLFNGNGDASYNAFDLDGFSLDGGGFFVICGNAANVANCDLDVSPDANLIQNGADAVALYQADATDFPNGTAVTTSGLVDALVYDTDDADDGGLLVLLNPGQAQVNENGAGDKDNHSNSRVPDGGIRRDTDTYAQQAPTPGAPNSPVPTVVINEVDADQPGTDAAEFIELFGTPGGSLNGFVIVLFNGSNDASYAAFDLDGQSLNAEGFFVLCGDAGNVANCDLDVDPNTNLIQNGADAVALYMGDASDFPSLTPVTTTNLVDALVYDTNDADDAGLLVLLNAGQPQVNEAGAGNATGHSNSRVPDGGVARNTNTYVQQAPTPGVSNVPPPVVEIYEIQGSGPASPYSGMTVTTLQNIVTAVGTDGFFIQTPDARSDADVNTSDGIFVFTGAAPTVASGDEVDVTGKIQEFFDFTEFESGADVTVVSSGNPLPTEIPFNGAVPSPDPTTPGCTIEFECYEGMLVSIADGSVGSGNQRFGPDPIAEAFIVAGSTRAFREPGIEHPGLGGFPVWDGNPEVFELDPDKLGLPNRILSGGSSFSATGVIGFEFSGYELWPTSLSVTDASLPVPVRDRVSGEGTVGSLNMFRFFDDVDDPSDTNALGQNRNDEVVSAAEFATHKTKLAKHIVDVLKSPDILAVQETEKLGVLEALATEIAALDPTVIYSAYLIEGNDVGTIDVGFLVRDNVEVDAVTQLGKSETFLNPVSGADDLVHDRPPLFLEGRFVTPFGDTPIAVMAVHNRSFNSIDDPVQGPRVRQKRLSQAQSIAQKVQDYQTANPDVGLVVIGDFNDFEFSDGYVDVVGQIRGDFVPADNVLSGPDLVEPNLTNQVTTLPPAERYSFVFQGSAQVLDHALTTTSLDPKVSGVAYGRGNADAALIFFDTDTTAMRASDHDGLVVFLDVTPPEIVVETDPQILWPVDHKYDSLTVYDFVISVSDGLTADDVVVTKVTSDELEDAPEDDGATLDDIVVADCQSVALRAERVGTGNGRQYDITVTASDTAGNIGYATFSVWAPVSRKTSVVADATMYEVTSGCTPVPSAEVLAQNSDVEEQALGKGSDLPETFSIDQNYPNPFNPTTRIDYALPSASRVRITVYNVLGRLVAELVDSDLEAGRHTVVWDAHGMSSGAYFYRIQAGNFIATKAMLLSK